MKIKEKPRILRATLEDYETIQNLARFYIYDMSRYCGFISDEWAIPKNGLYESFDYKSYITGPDGQAFLIKVGGEVAGFILIKFMSIASRNFWYLAEFFILAKFQGKGVAEEVAYRLWQKYPGEWELNVIPENTPALNFWRRVVSRFTNDRYSLEIREVDYDIHQPMRYFFCFDTADSKL